MPVAEHELSGTLHERGDEFVMHAVLHNEPARRGAPLPCRPERTPERPFERQVEIRVVEHDHRILAAHLEREPLVQPTAGFADVTARLRRPGERDERNVGVLDDGGSGFAVAVHELDHFGRKAGLEQDLDEHG